MPSRRILIVGQSGLAFAEELLALGHVVQHIATSRHLSSVLGPVSWEACIFMVDQLTAHDAQLVRHARETQPAMVILLWGRSENAVSALGRIIGADDLLIMARPREALRRVGDALARRQASLRDRGIPVQESSVDAETQMQLSLADDMATRRVASFAQGIAHEINNPATCIAANLTNLQDAMAQMIEELADEQYVTSRLDALHEMVEDSLEAMDRIRSLMKDLRTTVLLGADTSCDPRDTAFSVAAPPFAPSPGSSQVLPSFIPDSPLRVLLIDDEPLVLRALGRMLGTHAVDVARGGQEAMAMLASRNDYDLILCDLMMPGMDGIAVQAAIDENHPHLISRLVFCSGAALTERSRAFLEQSPYPMLEKPVSRESLMELVRSVQRRAGAAVTAERVVPSVRTART